MKALPPNGKQGCNVRDNHTYEAAAGSIVEELFFDVQHVGTMHEEPRMKTSHMEVPAPVMYEMPYLLVTPVQAERCGQQVPVYPTCRIRPQDRESNVQHPCANEGHPEWTHYNRAVPYRCAGPQSQKRVYATNSRFRLDVARIPSPMQRSPTRFHREVPAG
jgi:hypothetical protein